jgi:hypothetical protein
MRRENCFCGDDHASWPMIFSGVYDIIRFGLMRRCMRIASRPFTEGFGNLRVLTRCLAFSLAATDSTHLPPVPSASGGPSGCRARPAQLRRYR